MNTKIDVNEGSAALHCYLDDTPVDSQWMDARFDRAYHNLGDDWTVWVVGMDTMGRTCVVKEHRQSHATYRVFYTGTDLVHDTWKVQMVNVAKHLWLLMDAFGIESDIAR